MDPYDKLEMTIWLPVPFAPKYEVSSEGGFRKLTKKGFGRGTPWKNAAGYDAVSINNKHYLLHRIILEAFVGPSNGLNGCHIDGDKTNNKINNLKWATQKENMADKMRHGTVAYGSKSPLAKLDEMSVYCIRALAANGRQCKELSILFGVSRPTISAITHNKAWIENSAARVAASKRPK